MGEGLRVLQEIPLEELEADDADKVISVFHFSKELARTHGVPFRFVLKPVRTSIAFKSTCIDTFVRTGREVLRDEEAPAEADEHPGQGLRPVPRIAHTGRDVQAAIVY